jgi:hypothetical protein
MMGVEDVSPVIVCFWYNINPFENPMVMIIEYKWTGVVITKPLVMVPVKQNSSFILMSAGTMVVFIVQNPIWHMPVMSSSVGHSPYVASSRWYPVSKSSRWDRAHMTRMTRGTGYLGWRHGVMTHLAGRP